MPVTYTNRKGKTYILCQGTTKSGNPWYYFALEPKGEPLDEVPEGYEIRESVNGIVSLAKIRPQKILPEELADVEAAVARHRKAKNYRVRVKDDQIVIYTRSGPDAKDLAFLFVSAGPMAARRAAELEESLNKSARFKAEMRFVLDDEEKRIFHAERWCYKGSIDDWIELHARGSRGPIKKLARELVPKLDTEAFFDLW
jgi:hypothetical protein